jgi:phosphoglycerate dehydrogenase-like enzyme
VEAAGPLGSAGVKMWIPHPDGVALLGPVPAGVEISVLASPADRLPGEPDKVEFWVPPFLSGEDTAALADRMSGLRVVQLLTAGADAWIGRLGAGVTLCDARGVHDAPTSEWAMTAILSSLRRFDHFARAQGESRWSYDDYAPTDELAGKRVLIVGAGSIGAALAARLTPFEVEITHVARTARDGVHPVSELPELLGEADVVVLLVPLTGRTRGMVDRRFLAAMRDGALLVNAARGPVVDTAALIEELATGRISAAADVTDPEPLPADSPLWSMPNLLLTPHVAGSVLGTRRRCYALVGSQLRRYVAGEPLDNQVLGDY